MRRRSGPPPGRRDRPDRIGGGGLRWLGALLLIAVPLAAYLGYRLNLDPPVVVLSSELLEFGEQRLEVPGDPQSVRLVNQGEEPLLVGDLAIDGDAASDFALTSDDCRDRPLERDDLCRIGVVFTPSVGGPRRARLVVRSNGVNGTTSLPLLGQGTAPRLAVAPNRQGFGELTIGFASQAQRFELTNEGTAPLAIARVGLDGDGSADFVVRGDRCSRQRLAPGKTCSLDVVFVPTVEGERRASLRVSSDAAPGEPVRLEGLGLPQRPEFALAPERLELGAWPVGTASPPQEVTLTNAGNGPLLLRELRLVASAGGGDTTAAVASEDFEMLGGDCGVGALAPGNQCTVQVGFRARREGETVGALEILHGDDGLHRVPLLAVATAPRAFVDRTRLSFDEVALGARSTPRALRLSSTGSAPLTVEAVDLTGADARAFGFTSEDCGSTLDPGTACGLSVRFEPRRDGPHRAELVIRHNAQGSTERVALVGLGVSARLALDPTRLDFGEVAAGREGTQTLTARNSGRAPLSLRRLRLDGGSARDYQLRADRCSGQTLDPGAQCSVTVVFVASNAGARGARLRIEHSAGDPVEVRLLATAAEPAKPRLDVSPGRFAFGQQPVGGSSPIQTLTLRNTGEAPLRLERIGLGGANATDFQLVSGSCSDLEALAPGQQCTMGLRFAPTVGGDLRAEIVVLHAGEGNRRVLPVSGTGGSP